MFYIIFWLLNMIMPNSKNDKNTNPVNFWKFFSHKEIPHTVLDPKQLSDIKTSPTNSVTTPMFS